MRGRFDMASLSKHVSTGKRTIEMWIKEKGLRVSRILGKRLVKKD